MAGLLFLNPSSGSGNPTPGEVREAAVARGVRVHVLEVGEDIVELAREADADALGMAGGDGSLAAVASVAIERDLPFVVVPFGTRNHFARDVGLDRDDPIAALDAFVDGVERRVDVGRVGDRVFLNNVSLGVYARLVHRRERHRRRGDALARLRALAITARRRSAVSLRLDGQPLVAPIVLVASNAYTLELFSVGERERVDEGRLHLYVAPGWWPKDWEERTGERFAIEASAPRVRAAVDGEPAQLESPLDFRIDPLALRLLLPPAADEGQSAS